MNISDLSSTIIAKSDQLNADDLIGGEKVITISGVSLNNLVEAPIVLHYDGDDGRPFKPCLTVRRILLAAWGKNGNDWIGKQARLYCDPAVVYAGKEVGGIRVSALSDMQKPLSVKLSVTRGKKKEHRIDVLERVQKLVYPADKFESAFDAMCQQIQDGKMTAEQVITHCEKTGTLTEEQRQAIRDAGDSDDDFFGDDE